MGGPVQLRRLAAADLPLLAEIDRSEQLGVEYAVVDGRLVSRPCDIDVPGWDRDGDGDHSVAAMIAFAEPIVASGGHLIGAHIADEVAGMAVIDTGFEPARAWLALLHVDRAHRRCGVGTALWARARDLAVAAGAEAIYVSATPTGSAVGFYLSRGCRLATHAELNDRLVALEPDDIHLICPL